MRVSELNYVHFWNFYLQIHTHSQSHAKGHPIYLQHKGWGWGGAQGGGGGGGGGYGGGGGWGWNRRADTNVEESAPAETKVEAPVATA